MRQRQIEKAPETKRGRFRSACTVMLETIAIPAVKAVQLYGLDKVPGPTKTLSDRTEAFVKARGRFGMLASAFGWVPVGFGLTQLGAYLSCKFAALGGTLSDSIGYTAACVHPSIISLAIRKLICTGERDIGTARYMEATAVAEIPASVMLFTTLGAVLHSGDSPLVSIGKAICAALLSSLLAFSVWAAGFAAYWSRAVRGESSSTLASLKEFGKGFVSAATPWEHKTPGTAYEEAGAMVGTGFFIWALPWYAVRTISAAFVAVAGTTQEDFTRALFSITSGFDWLSVLLSGVKLSIVEGIIKRRNGGGGKPEESVHPRSGGSAKG
jgi:hypothetical protein